MPSSRWALTASAPTEPYGQDLSYPPPLLELTDVRVRYGKLVAVAGATFQVTQGSISTLLGLNGAGKSSLMNGISGLVPLDAGSIEVHGTRIDSMSAHRRAAVGIAYLPEGRGIFPSLSVEQNIVVGTQKRSHVDEELTAAFDLFPFLGHRRSQVAGSLSGGEQQMLSLARCLASRPDLLLLDEPSLGLATRIVEEFFAKLCDLRDQGISVLLVEQFAHAALGIADSAGILVRGELTRYGEAAALRGLSAQDLADLFFAEDHQSDHPTTPSGGEHTAV